MNLLTTEEIPAYEAARKAEQEARDLAFCDWPVPLCGLEVKQFTYLHLLVLGNCGNAFVEGGEPTVEDVAFFLWVVSPEYRPNCEAKRNEFIEAIAERVQFMASCREIYEYLDAAFMDSPGGSGAPGKSYTSFVAPICDIFAHEYGWDDQVTLNKPVARLNQLLRRIRVRRNPKAIQFNRSDRILSQAMARMMQQGTN